MPPIMFAKGNLPVPRWTIATILAFLKGHSAMCIGQMRTGRNRFKRLRPAS